MKNAQPRVLVIYTGGTIGMIRNENDVLAPTPNLLEKMLRNNELFHDQKYAMEHLSTVDSDQFLILPKSCGNIRVLYKLIEYTPLLDSCNMGIDEWIRVAKTIGDEYENYDGFVVLHGTDTLVYTASSLSFILENLGKIVVVTGSQIPIYDSRSDGKNNLLCSLIMAGSCNIPEVTVFFENKLFRGNRTVKVSSNRFNAFASPNHRPLAEAGVHITVDRIFVNELTDSIETSSKFQVHDRLNKKVALVRLYPTITSEILDSILKSVDGLVFETYGAGNMPSNRTDLIQVLKKATNNDVLVVNCTQCLQGNVEELYESGQVLKQAGVVFGADITTEAAFTKLCYVLSKNEWSIETKRKRMSENLRGELTETFHIAVSLNSFRTKNNIAIINPEQEMHKYSDVSPSEFFNTQE